MSTEWWPSLDEYNPNISKEKWLEILDNRNLTTEQNLHVFACIFNFGGEATCTQLAQKYGDTKNTYNSGSSNYAKNLVKANICEEPPFREDGNSRWWPVLYVGHNADKETSGSYVWKLRDELKEACKEYGIEKWLNIAKEDKSISKRIWKLSHGKDFSEDDVQYYLSESIACVHKDTSAKGVSYLPQGKAFTDEAKSGDLFYLCRGNQEILLIGEFISNEVDIDNDGRAYRKYKKLYSSIKKGSYEGPNKWWTPNNNSTFIEIKKTEYSEFEEYILIPFFGINLQTLNLLSGENEMDKINECKKLLKNTHNLILHGAPGTGKTHLAKDIAAQIMLNKNYNQLSDEEKESIKDQIGFVQFHPSFDYTDFIEGLRPVYNENDDVIFERKDGVFKKFCKNALPIIIKNNKSISNFDYIWNVLINKIRENIANNSLTKIGNWEYGLSSKNSLKYQSLDSKSKYNFTITKQNIYDVWQGKKARPKGGFQKDMVDIVSYMKELGLKDYSKDESSSFSLDIINEDAVKNALDNIVKEQIELTLKTGATYIFQIQKKDDEYQIFVKTSTVSKLHKDIFDFTCSNIINYITKNEEESKELDQNLNSYIGVVSDYIKNHYKIFKTEFVFIIDEINRGELSKIFGELFYCIDPGYRGECGKISTQYQNLIEEDDPFYDGFYIPENVYIIGTMNDIDRSVESMDFAFRRRFAFKEITSKDTMDLIIDSADIDENTKKLAKQKMENLNNAIWDFSKKDGVSSLSSAYHIGGAYFKKLETLKNEPDPFTALWDYHLEPLLREYLRGMEDAKDSLEKLHKAYNLENQE